MKLITLSIGQNTLVHMNIEYIETIVVYSQNEARVTMTSGTQWRFVDQGTIAKLLEVAGLLKT